MSEPTYTHADLTAAINKARIHDVQTHAQPDFADEHNAHLDTLTAILNRHRPYAWQTGRARCQADGNDWPCPDVSTVADALRRMGAL